MNKDTEENELLFDYLFYFLKKECKLGKDTSTKIASQFTELNKFFPIFLNP